MCRYQTHEVYDQTTQSIRSDYAEYTIRLRGVYDQTTWSIRSDYAEYTIRLRGVYDQTTRSIRAKSYLHQLTVKINQSIRTDTRVSISDTRSIRSDYAEYNSGDSQKSCCATSYLYKKKKFFQFCLSGGS